SRVRYRDQLPPLGPQLDRDAAAREVFDRQSALAGEGGQDEFAVIAAGRLGCGERRAEQETDTTGADIRPRRGHRPGPARLPGVAADHRAELQQSVGLEDGGPAPRGRQGLLRPPGRRGVTVEPGLEPPGPARLLRGCFWREVANASSGQEISEHQYVLAVDKG